MSDYKEFTGKTLDEAIQAACSHFSMERGKLEIEIESGGSTGIFGLVGVRKASIKARPRGRIAPLDAKSEAKKETKAGVKTETKPEAETRPKADSEADSEAKAERKPKPRREPKPADKGQDALEDAKSEAEAEAGSEAETERPRQKRKPRSRRSGRGKEREAANGTPDNNAEASQPGQAEPDPQGEAPAKGEGRSRSRRSRGRGRRGEEQRKAEGNNGNRQGRGRSNERKKPERTAEPGFDDFFDNGPEHDIDGNRARPDRPQKEMSSLDKDALESCVRQVVARLVGDLVQAPQLSVRVEKDKVLVFIEDEENSGLIIGREGQTLSALQYLTTRIVSREMDAAVRVQLDTGDYRERQNDKLKELAHQLAAKSISTGKVQSTRPLSSYHRRVVHLALQNATGVTTRSKGEGPTKRVLILPKKNA